LKITEKQANAILALPGAKRYDHLVKVVADQGQAWGLYKDGWALAADDNGAPVLPVWPAAVYAARCAINEWEGFEPRSIQLKELIGELFPRLRAAGTGLGVFYTPTNRGVLPDLELVERDLRAELGRIE
jgi:hypothetical protein